MRTDVNTRSARLAGGWFLIASLGTLLAMTGGHTLAVFPITVVDVVALQILAFEYNASRATLTTYIVCVPGLIGRFVLLENPASLPFGQIALCSVVANAILAMAGRHLMKIQSRLPWR